MAKRSQKIFIENSIVSSKGPATKSIKPLLRSHLNLPMDCDLEWDVVDTYSIGEHSLSLVHYTKDGVPSDDVRLLRGIIIDNETGVAFTRSHGYLEPIDVKEKLEVVENKMQVGDVELYEPKIYVGYESVFVRIFKWQGKVFFSTQRKIDGTKSHWGNRQKFYDMFRSCFPMEIDDLFGLEPTSPYCYYFIIIHPHTNIVSNYVTSKVLHVRTDLLWNSGEYSYLEGYEYPLKKFEYGERFQAHLPINVEIANKLLFSEGVATSDKGEAGQIELVMNGSKIVDVLQKEGGFRTGEFVVCFAKDSKGEMRFYRLESMNYKYRMNVVGVDENHFCGWLKDTMLIIRAKKNAPAKFKEIYDMTIQMMDSSDHWLMATNEIYKMVVGPVLKEEVGKYFSKYEKERDALINFIYKIMMKPSEISTNPNDLENRMYTQHYNKYKRVIDIVYQHSKLPVEQVKGKIRIEVEKLLFNENTVLGSVTEAYKFLHSGEQAAKQR